MRHARGEKRRTIAFINTNLVELLFDENQRRWGARAVVLGDQTNRQLSFSTPLPLLLVRPFLQIVLRVT